MARWQLHPGQIQVLAAGIFLSFSLTAGANAEAKSIPMQDGFPLTSRSNLYSLDEVKKGDRGVGYSVWSGAKVSPFGVEVLGIMRGMLGPKKDVILVKLSGPELEFTGVVSGMSGSPVYFDGRLAGAVAYRFGVFSKEPIAGVTPIETMLETEKFRGSAKGAPKAALYDDSKRFPWLLEPEVQGPSLKIATALGSKSAADFRPIETPLFVTGLHPKAYEQLKQQLQSFGPGPALSLQPGGGAAGVQRGIESNKMGEAGGVPAAPIAPGSPIAALLTKGDIVLSAVGTTTFVQGSHVLGFGHPFLGGGAVEIPMATSAILNTLATPVGSYKQGIAAREVGAILQDRLTAISGRLGHQAAMVPVDVWVKRLNRGKVLDQSRASVQVLNDSTWIPRLTEITLLNSSMRGLGYEAGGTVELDLELDIGDKTLRVQDRFSAPPPINVCGKAAHFAGMIAAKILSSPVGKPKVRRLRARIRTEKEIRYAWVERVVLDKSRVKAGETLAFTVFLRPYQSALRTLRMELIVPRTVSGPLSLVVGGGRDLDQYEDTVLGEKTVGRAEDVLGLIADLRPQTAVYAGLYAKRRGTRLGLESLSSLPPSQWAALEVSHLQHRRAMTEARVAQTKTADSDVVTGSKTVVIEVVHP